MIAKIILLDGKRLKNNFTIPYVFEGKGEYALELVITKAIEVYYGERTKKELENLLKIRLTDEIVLKNFELYMERKK